MQLKFPNYVTISAFETGNEEYLMVRNADGSITYTIEAKFIELLSNILSFNYTVVHPEGHELGHRLKDGNWTGSVGMVKNLAADLSISLLEINEERSEAIDFSYPYYITDTTFLTNLPQPLAKSLAIFYPFSYQLWITLAVTFVSMSVIFFVVLSRQKQFSRTLLTVLGSITGQSISFSITKASGWFLLIAWLLGVMFIKLSYEATLLSVLSFPPMEGVRNTAELVKAIKKGTYICKTFKGGTIIADLIESDNADYNIIGKSLRENSLRNMRADMAIISSPKKVAFFTIRRVLTALEGNFFLSKDSFNMVMIGIGMRKSFCCKSTLDKVIRRIVEAGLYEKLLKDQDEFGFIRISSQPDESSSKARHVLNLDDTTGAFSVLVLGDTFAILVFLLEKIFWKKMCNR